MIAALKECRMASMQVAPFVGNGDAHEYDDPRRPIVDAAIQTSGTHLKILSYWCYRQLSGPKNLTLSGPKNLTLSGPVFTTGSEYDHRLLNEFRIDRTFLFDSQLHSIEIGSGGS